PTRIRRALNDQGATTFWELLEEAAIPKETRGYVPTFFATLMIASDPDSYGFRLGKEDGLENPSHIEVEGPVSLRYIADVAGVDESVLRELNPALPACELASVVEQSEPYYTVRKGATLSSIARKHHLTVAELRDLNDLSARHKLHPGERLRITVARAMTAGGM